MGLIAKVVINIILIILTLLIGVFLQKNGKPYSSILLAFHKITTVAFSIFITLMLIQHVKLHSPEPWLTYMAIAGVLFLAGLLVSGGLMSVDRLDSIMALIHRVSTVGFIVSSGYILYYFLKNGS